MPVHASQDFVILSGQVGVDPDASPLAIIVLPTMIGLAILLWRRRRIDLEPARCRRRSSRAGGTLGGM